MAHSWVEAEQTGRPVQWVIVAVVCWLEMLCKRSFINDVTQIWNFTNPLVILKWLLFYLHLYTCHPLPFPQYSPFIEFCDQLAWEVFKILKALISTSSIKKHSLKLWCIILIILTYNFVYLSILLELLRGCPWVDFINWFAPYAQLLRNFFVA